MLQAVLLSLLAVAALALFFPIRARIRFSFSGKACNVDFKFWKFERSLHHEFSASDLKTSFVKPVSGKEREKERKKAEKERKKAEKARAKAAEKRKEEAKPGKSQGNLEETASYRRTETENLRAETAAEAPPKLPETDSPKSAETEAQASTKTETPTAEAQAQTQSGTATQTTKTETPASTEKVAPPPEAARIPHENDARRVPPPGERPGKGAKQKKQAEEFSERDFLTIWLQQESVSLLWRLGVGAFNRAFHLLGVKFEDSFVQGVRASTFERTGYLAALAGGIRAVFPALEGWNLLPDWSGREPFAVFGRCTLQTNLFRVLGLGLFALYVAARLFLHYFFTKRKYRKDPGGFELSWFRGKVVNFLSE